MITGDHAVTAAAIGRELGIEGRTLTGAEFAAMSDEQALRDLDNIGVIARVAPEDKIRLVQLLQKKGNIVAMTGDGVNDAPALKKADIGDEIVKLILRLTSGRTTRKTSATSQVAPAS